MPGFWRILNERKSHSFLYSDGETKATVEGKLLTPKITFNTMDLNHSTKISLQSSVLRHVN